MPKLQQLIYTKQEVETSMENPSTFVLMVDADMYEQHKKDKSIALANIVDSFDVLKYDHGKSGKLSRPSQSEIKDTFGFTNENDIAAFMIEHGSPHGKPNASNGEPNANTTKSIKH